MIDLISLDGKKAKFEGRIEKFDEDCDYYDKEDSDKSYSKIFPKMLLKLLYVRKDSAKDRIGNPDQIWVRVGVSSIKKLNPSIGEVISFEAHVTKITLDHSEEIHLKRLSKLKTMAQGNGQKFIDFWKNNQ